MNGESTPAQAKEYRVEIKEKRPAITISRETGAGAITIGQMVRLVPIA